MLGTRSIGGRLCVELHELRHSVLVIERDNTLVPLRNHARVEFPLSPSDDGFRGADGKIGVGFRFLDIWCHGRMGQRLLNRWNDVRFDYQPAVFMQATADGRLQLFVFRTNRKGIDGEPKQENAE